MYAPLAFLFGGTVLIILYCMLQRSLGHRPVLVKYQENEANDAVVKQLASLRSYRPVWWGVVPHVQTIVYSIVGRFGAPSPSGSRHLVRSADGTTHAVDVFEPAAAYADRDAARDAGARKMDDGVAAAAAAAAAAPEERPTLFVCPGIASSSRNAYIRQLVWYFTGDGFRVVVFNHLGCAGPDVPLTRPKIFSYGETEHLREVFEWTVARFPRSKMVLVGFSMGANMLVKMIGTHPELQRHMVCAMSFCQGYCCERARDWMSETRTWYNRLIATKLRGTVRAHQETFERHAGTLPIDLDRVLSSSTMQEFDELFATPIHGYNSLAEYYANQSCKQVLPNIKIPLVLVNAMDDPLIPMHFLDVAVDHATKDNPRGMFVLTRFGGHLGYFESKGSWLNPMPATEVWCDRLALEYFNAHLKRTSK